GHVCLGARNRPCLCAASDHSLVASFFFSSRRRHTRSKRDWSSDVCSSDLLYGEGISREGGLIDLGVEHGAVRKSGAWFTYEGDQLGQGKENARQFLKDNPDLAAEIEEKILRTLGVGKYAEAPEPAEDSADDALGEGEFLDEDVPAT